MNFDSSLTNQSSYVGRTFPIINAAATSTNDDCVISTTSYTLSDTVSGISISSTGIVTVDTSSVIVLTNFTASVVVGS